MIIFANVKYSGKELHDCKCPVNLQRKNTASQNETCRSRIAQASLLYQHKNCYILDLYNRHIYPGVAKIYRKRVRNVCVQKAHSYLFRPLPPRIPTPGRFCWMLSKHLNVYYPQSIVLGCGHNKVLYFPLQNWTQN